MPLFRLHYYILKIYSKIDKKCQSSKYNLDSMKMGLDSKITLSVTFKPEKRLHNYLQNMILVISRNCYKMVKTEM